MKPDEVLLAQFFKGTCTPQEARQVMDWLLENEEYALWEQDWKAASPEAGYPEACATAMLQEVYAHTFNKQVRVKRMPWRTIAAAASVLLLTGLFVWQQQQPRSTRSAALTAREHLAKPRWIIYQAPPEKRLQLQLTDGSSVMLEPGSVLKYDSLVYNTRSRQVYLQGKGSFQVAASEARPFSVSTGSFTTIALGTSFQVSSLAHNDLQVRLYSGKVMVRQTGTQMQVVKETYLQPGEELVYNMLNAKTLVSRFNQVKRIPALPNGQHNTIREYDDCIVFDNTPLKNVLAALEQQYHIPISYEQRAVTRVYFSGKVLRADSLELILNTIVRINNLTLLSKNGGYIIQ